MGQQERKRMPLASVWSALESAREMVAADVHIEPKSEIHHALEDLAKYREERALGRSVATLDQAMDNVEEVMDGLNCSELRDLCITPEQCTKIREAIRDGGLVPSAQGFVSAAERHLCLACQAFERTRELHAMLDELYVRQHGRRDPRHVRRVLWGWR